MPRKGVTASFLPLYERKRDTVLPQFLPPSHNHIA